MNTPIEPPPAVILSFGKRRGRPKLQRPRVDTGTPELVMKRLMGDTMEALDLCLERRLISESQHWCGIHLRWLYTLRHGAPTPQALDPSHTGGFEAKADDPAWRSAREQEYHEAMALITASGHALIVMNLCIYNERPPFLKLPNGGTAHTAKLAGKHLAYLRKLSEGLDLLAAHWKRAKPGASPT